MQYVVASALVAYAAGFLVTFAWARSLQRRHALDDRRAAVAPALLGGALGGICVLLIFATSQAGLLAR
ncbi:MAG: hypothetical protein QOJ63_435 [Solirubrobacteraceae bacterium]|jgi:ammonia channel protein AmtB|nr:hypothetical protein [Solirubrobacteraceae bacterium]